MKRLSAEEFVKELTRCMRSLARELGWDPDAPETKAKMRAALDKAARG